MSSQQLWQECLPLTHHSLEAFLLSVLERSHIYDLQQFLNHPQITTVDKNLLHLYTLFANGVYSQLTPQHLQQLSKPKLLKLKKLTILSLFQGLKEIPLRNICSQIQSTQEQTIDLLIDMSISGHIQVKINEQKSNVQIHYAEVRARAFSHEQTQLLEGKISTIIKKNKAILDIIDQTYSEIKNKHEGRMGEGFRSPKLALGGKKF